jgi:uncharacterized protein (DUF58 family)
MVVPQTRLLIWLAAVGLPWAAAAAVSPAARWLGAGLLLGLVGAALWDGVVGLRRLRGLEVQLPQVIRLAKDRPGLVPVHLRNPHNHPRALRLGIAWPESIQATDDQYTHLAPTGSGWARLDWPCTARRRGCYRVTEARLETGSPLGLWAVRTAQAVEAEVRVYPNLQRERRQLAGLFLHRTTPGAHAQRLVGKGREFEQLRDYIPGDSFEDIHWKATAKRGRPVTKLFQIERTQEIYVVIDFSRLSARPVSSRSSSAAWHQKTDTQAESTAVAQLAARQAPEAGRLEPTEPALERFISAALVLGSVAEQHGDLFGVVSFADKVQTFIRARTGPAHYDACREALYQLEPRMVSPDFEEVATFIRLHLRRRALLMFLTALDDPVLAEGFVRAVDVLGRQHLLRVNMLQPPGVRPLFTNLGVSRLDDLYDELAGHLQWQRLRQLQKVLQRRGAPLALLDPGRLTAQLAEQYLSIKRRQAL